MKALPTHWTVPPIAVSLVSSDDLLARRVRDSLARGAVDVVDSAADVDGLTYRTGTSDAIILAGWTSVATQRGRLRAAATRFPLVHCVLIAQLASNGVRKALDAGAAGVVLESDIEIALPDTVRAVRVNQVVTPRRIGHVVRPPLTHREKEILALVARGLTNRQIATELFLTESTVKTHLASIFAKLGVSSRSEATALVLDPDENLGLNVVSV